MARTMQQLAQECLQAQDASNLIGLSKAFAKAVQELVDVMREDGSYTGTDSVAQHPIVKWWVNKLELLAGTADTESYLTLTRLAEGVAAESGSKDNPSAWDPRERLLVVSVGDGPGRVRDDLADDILKRM